MKEAEELSSKSREASEEVTREIYKKLSDRKTKEVMALLRKLRHIEEAVDRVEEPTQRNALRCRYIYGMKVAEVAEELHYSLRHISDILKKAIKAINL